MRVSIGRDGVTGKRVYEAQSVRNARITVRDYLSEWLENIVKSQVREATFESYKYHLEHYLGTLSGRFLKDLTALDIQKVYNDLRCRHSPRTVQYVHSIFKSALKRAVKMRLISENPCDFVELPKRIKRQIKVFTPEEAKSFLRTARDDRRGLIFEFALLTGARPEEYLAVKWSDLDMVRNTITFQRTIAWRKGGGWTLSDEMKTPAGRYRKS